MSRVPKNGSESDLMTLKWDKGERGSIRTPLGLRDRISKLLKELEMETGVVFTRNEFVLNAIRFYTRHLLRSRSTDDLLERMREEFTFDNGNEDSIESSSEDDNGDTEVRDTSGEDRKPESD